MSRTSIVETPAEFSSRGGKASGAARQAARIKRQTQVVALWNSGLSKLEISRQLGVSVRTVFQDLADCADVVERVEQIIEDAGVDAHDVWIQLSRIFDGDRSEILDEAGNVKPMREWPLVFRQCLNVVIEDISQRSHDGETKDKGGGWDKTGKRVRILGIDPTYLRALELSMKHKNVDAMVQQKAGDTNILVITADRARQVQSAKKRLERVIDVKAEEVKE